MSAETHLYNPLLFYKLPEINLLCNNISDLKISFNKIIENKITEYQFKEDSFDSLYIFKEYLLISENLYNNRMASKIPNKLKKILTDFGAVRSHSFKMFDGLLQKLDDAKLILATCKSYKDFHSFIDYVELNIKEAYCSHIDFKMGPRIRNSTVNVIEISE